MMRKSLERLAKEEGPLTLATVIDLIKGVGLNLVFEPVVPPSA